MRFATEAWPFVLPVLVAGLLVAFWSLGAAIALWALALAVLLFFRDPAFRVSGQPGDIAAPAYGKVLAVDQVELGELAGDMTTAEHGTTFTRVITFLSIFSVHVQRCPTAGVVRFVGRREGGTAAAYRLPEGDANASCLTLIRRGDGDLVGVRQVVGWVARRIVVDLSPGREIARGDRLGLIRFGSRVDLLVPPAYTVLVRPGDTVRGGVTPMARPADGTEA